MQKAKHTLIHIAWLFLLVLLAGFVLFKHTLSIPSKIKPSAGSVNNILSNNEGEPADVEFVNKNGMTDVYVYNRMAGPLQVQLSSGNRASNMQALPSLPITFLLNPNQRLLAVRLQADQSQQPMISDLVSIGIPGDPRAFPEDLSYAMPVDENSRWELGQGFEGEYSHQDEQNRYAIDFIVPIGTPVLAARDGVVMDVASGFSQGGTDVKRFAQRANFIRVLHDDGSMGLYAHLQENGVLVKVGQRIHLGQHIAYSGNTGFTSGPHLHFALQINTGMRSISIPFRMVGPGGYLPLSR
jgi:murein DD-endopeptidase MepM/ murein hydrolase activator NlpD